MTAKELQDRIDQLRKEIGNLNPGISTTNSEIAKRQSEIFVAASQLAEISTKRIVFLTWALLVFTIALFSVEVRAVFFPKDTTTNIEAKQASQQQVVIPSITNR